MDPKPGQHIKIFFRNGAMEEGTVVSWSPQKSVLKSLLNDDLMVIQKTIDDIMIIKILKGNKPQVYVEPQELEERIPEPELRAKRIAELHELRSREERSRARNLLTTFRTSGPTMTQYGIPKKI